MRRAAVINAPQLPCISISRLDPGGEGVPFNPSILVFQDKILAMVRTIHPRTAITTNVFGEIVNGRLCSPRRVMDFRRSRTRLGYEDCRLFHFNGSLWCIATCMREKTIMPEVAVIELDPRGEVVSVSLQSSQRAEKNWMPVVDSADGNTATGGRDRLRFIYTIDPLVILEFSPNSKEVTPSPVKDLGPGGILRGGSQLIPYGDGWLSVIHEVSGDGRRIDMIYTHRFATFDKELSKVKIGKPFYLQKRGIEFVAGLARLSADRFMISYGIEDKNAYVSEISTETVEEFTQEG